MRFASSILLMFLATASIGAPRLNSLPQPAVPDAVKDTYTPIPFDDATITGMIGDRMQDNITNRLLKVDEKRILAGFQHPPGEQIWIGEHAGKFLHAAANAWANSGNAELKAKMDRVAHALIAAQQPDGYLGTYTPDQRWTSWDVWVHKYDMIGLMRYYQVTGDESALNCCRKIGDLLCNTFGDDDPKKRDIIAGDPQMGLASCSVLEPMCTLYRYTGEKRYLDFCLYITRAYNHPGGPHLIEDLQHSGKVFGTANNKSYEMLSNLLGLLDLYRITGDQKYFDVSLAAWKDINEHRLFPDGTTSNKEHFQDDDVMPASEGADVGEGCVTVTWMQFNLSLLKLTDLMWFEEDLEKTIYNALLAAENPNSGDVCYFTPLDGQRDQRPDITCCCSSVPRGIALIPEAILGTADESTIRFNLYIRGKYTVQIHGQPVTLAVQTDFPRTGKVTMTVSPTKPDHFDLILRVPTWTDLFTAKINGQDFGGEHGAAVVYINRDWQPGDQVHISMDMTPHLLDGGKSYPDCVAVTRGPQLLAAEADQNPGTPPHNSMGMIGLSMHSIRTLQPVEGGYTIAASIAQLNPAGNEIVADPLTLKLIPFANGINTRVWFKAKNRLPLGPAPLTMGGKQSASRTGNFLHVDQGSITDLDPETMMNTHDNTLANEDWFAVQFAKPGKVSRVIFTHGFCQNSGGWFDTSAGKPRIQIKKTPNDGWQDIATINDYPDTNSKDIPDLTDGQTFEVKLDQPTDCTAIRVIGKPSSGNKPKQNFSTCAELTAYEK